MILEDIILGTKKLFKDPYAEERISKSGKTYYLNMINEICYSPKLGYWAMIPKTDRKIHIYTRDLKKEVLVIPIEAQVLSMIFSRDSKYLGIGCRDKNLYVWDIQANKLYAKFSGHQNGVTSVSFSDDNQYVISGSYDNTIRVWGMKEKREIMGKRDASEYDINSVALSPNHKYYVFADKRLVHVKDFMTKKEIYTLNIDDAQTVFYSQDGRYIYIVDSRNYYCPAVYIVDPSDPGNMSIAVGVNVSVCINHKAHGFTAIGSVCTLDFSILSEIDSLYIKISNGCTCRPECLTE